MMGEKERKRMSESLIALDTDQIKSYVFATGKLKEIRGLAHC